MPRIFMVLATALAIVLPTFVEAASAAPGPLPGPTYTTSFEPSWGFLPGRISAALIPGGDITAVCAGVTNGSTFTLNADCGPVDSSLTVPANITTVDGAGHTISADDNGQGVPQFNGGIVANAGRSEDT